MSTSKWNLGLVVLVTIWSYMLLERFIEIFHSRQTSSMHMKEHEMTLVKT
jgi:hypothetical protein